MKRPSVLVRVESLPRRVELRTCGSGRILSPGHPWDVEFDLSIKWRRDPGRRSGASPCASRASQARSYRPTEPKDSLKQLNSAFPPQMVAATDPEYERKLLDKIDKGAGA